MFKTQPPKFYDSDIEDEFVNAGNFDDEVVDFAIQNNDSMEIMDAGFDKLNQRSGSFVGSPHYVSPEMLNFCHAGIEADYWALGCILYTLLFGQIAFDGKTEHLTFQKIIKRDFKFPEDALDTEMDIIDKLLKLEPA